MNIKDINNNLNRGANGLRSGTSSNRSVNQPNAQTISYPTDEWVITKIRLTKERYDK